MPRTGIGDSLESTGYEPMMAMFLRSLLLWDIEAWEGRNVTTGTQRLAISDVTAVGIALQWDSSHVLTLERQSRAFVL